MQVRRTQPKTSGTELTNESVTARENSLERLIERAGLDLRELCDAFEEVLPSSDSCEARQMVERFKGWLRQNDPEQPFLKLQIVTTAEARIAAGISPLSAFSTETAAHERDGNNHCAEDQAKWFAWIEQSKALHICDWGDDEYAFIEAVTTAIQAGAPILVIELLG